MLLTFNKALNAYHIQFLIECFRGFLPGDPQSAFIDQIAFFSSRDTLNEFSLTFKHADNLAEAYF